MRCFILEMWIIILSTVLGLLIIGGFSFYLYRRSNPSPKKPLGKNNKASSAISILRKFARTNDFRFISPAVFYRNGVESNLDAIAIGYFGVIGVKALGYNGEIYGTTTDKEWLQVNEGGKRNPFPNPIIESSADVRAIREVLINAKLKQVPVEVVCVFTEPTAQLAIPRSTGHYTLKEFKSLLRSEKYYEEKINNLDDIEKAINQAQEQPKA